MMTGCSTPHSLRDHCQQCASLILALPGLAAAFCRSIKMRAVILLALLALAAARVEPEGVLYPFDREPARGAREPARKRPPNVIQVGRRCRRLQNCWPPSWPGCHSWHEPSATQTLNLLYCCRS